MGGQQGWGGEASERPRRGGQWGEESAGQPLAFVLHLPSVKQQPWGAVAGSVPVLQILDLACPEGVQARTDERLRAELGCRCRAG